MGGVCGTLVLVIIIVVYVTQRKKGEANIDQFRWLQPFSWSPYTSGLLFTFECSIYVFSSDPDVSCCVFVGKKRERIRFYFQCL